MNQEDLVLKERIQAGRHKSYRIPPLRGPQTHQTHRERQRVAGSECLRGTERQFGRMGGSGDDGGDAGHQCTCADYS